jgi:hypothetical protein
MAKTENMPSAPLRALTKQFDPSACPDIYAIPVAGICMSPVIADGAVIAVSKLTVPKAGDYVVLWLRPELVPLGVSPAQVTRLVSADWDLGQLLLERFIPSKFFSLSTSELIAVHKAIGLFPGSKPGGHDLKTLTPFPRRRPLCEL